MAQHDGLIADLLTAMADPTIVQSHQQDPKIIGPPSQHMGETLSAFMANRDRYEYDQQDINGVPYNATDGYGVASSIAAEAACSTGARHSGRSIPSGPPAAMAAYGGCPTATARLPSISPASAHSFTTA